MKTSEQEDVKNNIYEIGCLFVPVISDKDVLNEVSNIKSLLEGLKCEFLSGDGPNMKELAYPMKKIMAGDKHLFKEAYFVWLKFTADSDKMEALKKDLDKYENILRYILIKTVKEDILVSNQKKVFAKVQDEKEKKVIKPAKVVTLEESTIELAENKEVEKPEAEKKDLDETIDKLVIK